MGERTVEKNASIIMQAGRDHAGAWCTVCVGGGVMGDWGEFFRSGFLTNVSICHSVTPSTQVNCDNDKQMTRRDSNQL